MKPISSDQVLTLLAAAPPHIAELTAGLPEEHLHTPPAPDDWSAIEVLAHLRSCADVWGDCMAIILTQDRPTIRAMNPRTWIKKTDYPEQVFHSSLEAFAAQRARLLAVLEPLAPAEWERSASVTGAGKPLERTLRDYAEWLATHERPHVKQIARIAKMLG